MQIASSAEDLMDDVENETFETARRVVSVDNLIRFTSISR